MAIKHATDADFQQLVLEADKPVIVDFWAAWCGPCKLVAPEMEKLAAKYEGAIDIVKVDVDANPALSRGFNIMSIPTIAFFPGQGEQPRGFVGFRPADAIEQAFDLAKYTKPASPEPVN
jgi:thioredoxin 1